MSSGHLSIHPHPPTFNGKGQTVFSSRRRTISVSSVRSSSSKIMPDTQKASPTLVLSIYPKSHCEALGSFTTVDSAAASLRALKHSKRALRPIWTISFDDVVRDGVSSGATTPSSPLSINSSVPSIPSISRTSSSYTSSSASLIDGRTSHAEGKVKEEMNPILAGLERKSKLCTHVQRCATCDKPGRDFPRCARCGEMWCSRECRLPGGAKRHVCSRTTRTH